MLLKDISSICKINFNILIVISASNSPSLSLNLPAHSFAICGPTLLPISASFALCLLWCCFAFVRDFLRWINLFFSNFYRLVYFCFYLIRNRCISNLIVILIFINCFHMRIMEFINILGQLKLWLANWTTRTFINLR